MNFCLNATALFQWLEQFLTQHPYLTEVWLDLRHSALTMPHSLYYALTQLKQLRLLRMPGLSIDGHDGSLLPLRTSEDTALGYKPLVYSFLPFTMQLAYQPSMFS